MGKRYIMDMLLYVRWRTISTRNYWRVVIKGRPKSSDINPTGHDIPQHAKNCPPYVGERTVPMQRKGYIASVDNRLHFSLIQGWTEKSVWASAYVARKE